MNSQFNESIEIARNAKTYLTKQSSANEHQIFNVCSSMIQKPVNQKPKTATKAIKKLILNKLKKFRHRMSINSDNTPALQKFTYRTDFINDQSCIVDLRQKFEISEFTMNRNSTLKRHGSCDISIESNNQSNIILEESNECDQFPESDLFLFNRSEEISYLFDTIENPSIVQQGPSASTATFQLKDISRLSEQDGQTSTPILKRRQVPESSGYECNMTMDESTQVIVDEPILMESTFETSSCSNLSSDLIILQTGYTTQKKTSSQNIPASITVNEVPEWAKGHQLNLAVVNQVYFEKNGMKMFD